jgi:hypothetical protein
VYDGGMNRDDLRKEVEDADDTGLVAGEEMITQAETLGPLLGPAFPRSDLHAALPEGHHAHDTIDALDAEINKESPQRPTIEKHVESLRGVAELEAIVANWWDAPKTQRFVDILGRI